MHGLPRHRHDNELCWLGSANLKPVLDDDQAILIKREPTLNLLLTLPLIVAALRNGGQTSL